MYTQSLKHFVYFSQSLKHERENWMSNVFVHYH